MSNVSSPEPHPSPSGRRAPRLREVVLPGVLAIGDAVCAVAGLILGYAMRYHTPIADLGIPVSNATLGLYLPMLNMGAAMLIATYVYLGLYDPKLLLRRVHGLALIMKALAFWLAAFLGVSLVLKFEPPISRLFVLVAFGTTLVITYLWRNLFHLAVTRRAIIEQVRQRVAVLGDDARTRTFLDDIARHTAHPFAAVGYIGGRGHALNPDSGDGRAAMRGSISAATVKLQYMTPSRQHLGSWEELESIILTNRIDIIVIGSLELPHEAMARVIEVCERTYTEWKVIPSAFELFVSNLQLETHGGVPVLGVGPLPVRRVFNRVLKRLIDLALASIALVVSAPALAVAALAIRRESPGPVLFKQTRIGAHHRPFVMLKLRTMRIGAEVEDAQRQSTSVSDPRVLKIGRILRRWNIDELPQLWNVLHGEMSLVGPRPERPYHVDNLSQRIPHYLPRHLAKPGMTGWAQINGCRGEGDLEKRIQHDIYYIENWSLLLDLQIMLLTLLRWKAPE